MIHLRQAVVVEGRYDKAKLASILDAVIIETGGFRIFKDKEKLAMLREIFSARKIARTSPLPKGSWEWKGCPPR